MATNEAKNCYTMLQVSVSSQILTALSTGAWTIFQRILGSFDQIPGFLFFDVLQICANLQQQPIL